MIVPSSVFARVVAVASPSAVPSVDEFRQAEV